MRPIVLVDARNVLRSEWPNIREQELVARCKTWAEEKRVHVWLVFDGEAPGGGVGEQEAAASVRVVGTGERSADDWIAEKAQEHRRRDEGFWLVTSDRELQSRASRGADRVIGGGTFARSLPRFP